MTRLRFVHAILLTALFTAAPVAVSGKLISQPYSVDGIYSLQGGTADDHYFPGQDHFSLNDFAPQVSDDVVDYKSGEQSAGVGPFVAGPSKSTTAFADLTMHGQVGSFKISTEAYAYSQSDLLPKN
jgi:hypothetical protein